MESQQPHQQPNARPAHHQLHQIHPPPPLSHMPPRTSNSTPVSSPGLFSPAHPRSTMSLPSQQVHSESTTPAGTGTLNSPFLHPLQSHKVRETHKANVEHDYTTGRKLINHYEIIEELGRGMHGKVKLARNLETGDNVAIKIIPRFSKKRRLGKVTAMSTQDKSKREIAILKKIRHPNVVALLEIIDDPELKKIYMVLEHVELGEIVWRKKGLPHIFNYERKRVEKGMRGEQPTPEEQQYEALLERRQALKDSKRAKMSQAQASSDNFWSLEYGAATDDEDTDSHTHSHSLSTHESLSYRRPIPSLPNSLVGSRTTSRAPSRAPSRTHSTRSLSRAAFSQPLDPERVPIPDEEDLETPGPLRSNPLSSSMLDGTMYGSYVEDPMLRGRSPSMADSIISHMSSIDYHVGRDPYADDFSYVPCFTFEQARQTFRDTVLGLEYLHYQGVVHRDIKPANLLWTKDHRVKISDFGVSYFGRPVRDGEPDETISESEARDFDNDLELAKTVGTPAFFAPELCYTDSYTDKPSQQPKVTEQIDVWSLGVTLYCLIYARIPFLAEDEWQMFKKIATEEVYIPTKRLRPVDPATKPDEKSLYTRVNHPPYRDDDELSYEPVEPDLLDLLSKMLIKNPEKRIRLRDVKRHPWVTTGVGNVISWLDDTDPSRKMSGRRIQVDDKEVAHAVVPLTLLERARSAVKKAVGKVMHPRGERADSVSSRRRATSSAASSAGDSPVSGLSTPFPRDGRRKSIRPDDYFSTLSQIPTDHPLTQHITASPHDSPLEDTPASTAPQSSTSLTGQASRRLFDLFADPREDIPDRPVRALSPRTHGRHVHHHSVSNAFLSLTAAPNEARTMPPTPMFDGPGDDPSAALRKARDMRPASDDSSRARSVDRGLFASADKRAEPKVSLSTAMAPGNVHFSPRPAKSTGMMKTPDSDVLPWTSTARSSHLMGYQLTQPRSDPNIHDKQRISLELEERPLTAHRVENVPQLKTAPVSSSTSVSHSQTLPHRVRYSMYQHEEPTITQQLVAAAVEVNPTQVPLPPSPDKDTFGERPQPRSREDTMVTTMSSSSTSIGAMTTPLTSPSEATSPLYAINPTLARDAVDHILAFQSDPSLPALLSSTSSVSADLEGEFLGNPGVVGRSVIDTTDSLTPPAFTKEPVAGFPLEAQEQVSQGAFQLDARGTPVVSRHGYGHYDHDHDHDEDSDSDEGLVMAKKPKKMSSTALHAQSTMMGKLSVGSSRRRDTNASVGSTDTAKKIVVDHSD